MAGELLITSSFDNGYICNDGKEKEVKVCIGIQPSKELRNYLRDQRELKQGVDLYLIIDSSSSMLEIVDNKGAVRTGRIDIVEGKRRMAVSGGICKLDVAKEAAKKIVEKARDIDRISLVVYNDNSSVVFNSINGENKNYILGLIDGIKTTGNSTNFLSALETAKTIVDSNSSSSIKKAILLTDGMPNTGSEEDIINAAEALGLKGVSLDCLGIGRDINFGFLEKLSTKGNGRTEIVKKGDDAVRVFEGLFEKSKDVVITNAVLKLKNISNLIRVTEHYQGTPENRYLGKVRMNENREIHFNLGQVEKNQLYNFYFKAIVPDQGDFNGRFRLMNATVEYSVPALHGDYRLSMSHNVILEVGNVRNYARMDSDVTTGYLLAEVKRYEAEAEKYKENREHQYVISSYEKIISIYENLADSDLANAYRDILEEYKTTGNINLQKLNQTMNSSSKAGDSGLLEDLEDDQVPNIKTIGRNR